MAIVAGLALGAFLTPIAVPLLTGWPNGVTRSIAGEFAPGAADPVAAFYASRHDRPLWVTRQGPRPEAAALIAILNDAGADDLDPAAYVPDRLTAEAAAAKARPDSATLSRVDVDLSRAFAAYVGDLRRPPAAAALAFVDPAVRLPPTDPASILADAARAPDLAVALDQARRMNPIYDDLRSALATARASGDRRAPLIAANLERARALPPDLGGRYILVNPAAQTLWFNRAGAAPQTMPVVVGTAGDQTPAMIGLLRYALANPYWNVPPDLVRGAIAPAVLREGPGYLARRRFEALADFSAQAPVIDPASVDWPAVAAGTRVLRVRQLPGGDNLMGRLKFMLPNRLGIYLHDTPLRAEFAAEQRTDSHGCVRLQDAGRLALWILGHPVAATPTGGPDQRVDIAPPIPVYILYLTAQPQAGGAITYLPDIYRRDPPLMAALAARRTQSTVPAGGGLP